MVYTCQFCKKRILTDIEHQSTWLGVGLSVILFLILRVFSFPLIIILIPLTQQIIHKCPKCCNTVGSRSFFDVLSLGDSVISYKIGNFGVILTRKQLFSIFMFLLFVIIFYVFFSNISLSKESKYLLIYRLFRGLL